MKVSFFFTSLFPRSLDAKTRILRLRHRRWRFPISVLLFLFLFTLAVTVGTKGSDEQRKAIPAIFLFPTSTPNSPQSRRRTWAALSVPSHPFVLFFRFYTKVPQLNEITIISIIKNYQGEHESDLDPSKKEESEWNSKKY